MPELTQIQLDIRVKMILLAKQNGLSLQEISDIFNNPISKSRVDQIINAAKAKSLLK